MTTTEFFADYHYAAFDAFVDVEVSEILQDTSTHDENFVFDDVPF